MINIGAVDGIFGKNTDAAIRNFQKSYGLTPDGIIGPKTLQALKQAANTTNYTASYASSASTTPKPYTAPANLRPVAINSGSVTPAIQNNTYIKTASASTTPTYSTNINAKPSYKGGSITPMPNKTVTAAANTAYMAYHSTGSIAHVYTGGSTSPSYIRNGSTTPVINKTGSSTPYITYNSSGSMTPIFTGGSSTPKVNVMAGGIGGSTTPINYKTYDKNGKTQTTNFFSVVKNFGEGLGEAVEDTAKGVANVATHPKEVVNGIEYAVSHPAETVNAIKNETVKTYNEFKNGDTNTKAKILGDITGEVALSAIGTKGIDKAVKAVKEAGVIARTAEAAETVSDATKAASVAEKATVTAVKEVTTQTVEKATFDELREVARFLKESGIHDISKRRSIIEAFNPGAKVAAESKVSAAAEEVGALESSNVIKGTHSTQVTINNDVLGKPRVGSALKLDEHHAFPDMVDNYAGLATKTPIKNGTLYQIEGSLNGVQGRFEWIIDSTGKYAGQVTHRYFVPGGTLNGVPIKP